MPDLWHQKCLHHPAREAVARCPDCRRHFCRECVVEHEDRLLCADCLGKAGRPVGARRFRWGGAGQWGLVAGSLLVGWLFFYAVGQALLALPTAFHEGTLWQPEPTHDTDSQESTAGGFRLLGPRAGSVRCPQETHPYRVRPGVGTFAFGPPGLPV